MSNLTVSIDDELLRVARIKAVQQGTSVNEVCRRAIDAFVRDDDEQAKAAAHARAQAFYDHALSIRPAPTTTGRPPTREELYEQVMSERLPRHWPGPKRKG